MGGYAAVVGMTAAATSMAGAVAAQAPQAQIALFFAPAVVIAAAVWGGGASLLAAGLGVASFDVFLTGWRSG